MKRPQRAEAISSAAAGGARRRSRQSWPAWCTCVTSPRGGVQMGEVSLWPWVWPTGCTEAVGAELRDSSRAVFTRTGVLIAKTCRAIPEPPLRKQLKVPEKGPQEWAVALCCRRGPWRLLCSRPSCLPHFWGLPCQSQALPASCGHTAEAVPSPHCGGK